jgi:ribosome maturation factor RimP
VNNKKTPTWGFFVFVQRISGRIAHFFYYMMEDMAKIESTLHDRLASIVSAMGYEFIGGELESRGRGGLLRLFIDDQKGITLDDCSRVSYQVSAMLDVEDPIQGRYTLEVSSPGLDRPLFEIAHYQKQIGNRIKLRLCAPIQNRRKFIGILLRVDGDDIHLLVDTNEVVLPFSNIEKANVIADIR